MTAYFDAKHEQVSAILKEGEAGYRKIAALEAELVWDVTLASEAPGFPEDLRDEINKLVLKYGAESLPVNAKGADYFSFEGHCAGINSLVWDLHTVFHDVAKRHLDGFSDDPRTPLRIIYARGEERREQMVEAQNIIKAVPSCPECATEMAGGPTQSHHTCAGDKP